MGGGEVQGQLLRRGWASSLPWVVAIFQLNPAWLPQDRHPEGTFLGDKVDLGQLESQFP